MDFKLSPYGRASGTPSPVSSMMSAFAADFRPGQDINLGVGYVNERTIPGGLIIDALKRVLASPEKHKTPFNYGGPRGSANLIASIANFIVRSGKGCLTREQLRRREIIIGASGSTSLLEAVACVLQPGIVITPDPMYYIYCNYLERMGFEVLTVAEDDAGMRADLLRAQLERLGARAAEISFFYIVSVNNPTATVLTNARRREIVAVATQLSKKLDRKIPLLFDTAYEDLIHDKSLERPQSALLIDELGLVHETGSLSKILSPAMRIGYLIGSPGPLMDALVQKTSDVGFSAPLISQEVASYLLDHHVTEQIERVNAGYREKAHAISGWIGRELGNVLEACTGGSAAFYFYLTFAGIETCAGSPFFKYATRTTGDPAIDGPPDDRHPRVMYVPGQYCVHPRGALAERGLRQLRISYGFEELEQIEQALILMREAAEYSRWSRSQKS